MFPHVLSIFFKSSKIASYYFRYHLNKNGAKILRIRFKNFSFPVIWNQIDQGSPNIDQYFTEIVAFENLIAFFYFVSTYENCQENA